MRKNFLTIIFYVIAGIMLLSFCLTFYQVTTYIYSLLEAGSVTLSANWLDIIMYYINNTLIYLGLGTLIFGMGFMFRSHKRSNMSTNEKE